MDEDEFNRHKTALAAQRLEKPRMMSTLSTVFWSEISSQQYNFDRTNIEVAYLKTLTKEQILEFFKVNLLILCFFRRFLSFAIIELKRYINDRFVILFFQEVIHAKAPKRRKLAVHILSMVDGGAGLMETSETKSHEKPEQVQEDIPIEIKDIVSFKASQSLYPLVKPFDGISRKGQRSKL